MTKKELADLLGLKPRQIDNLVIEGLPRTKEGRRYEYGAAAVAWYYQRKQETARPKDSTMDEAKLRYELARAETAELDLEARRGALMPMPQHLEIVTLVGARVRARILAMPGKYAPRTVGLKKVATAKQVWEDAIYDVLEELTQLTLSENGRGRPQPKRRRRKRNRAS